MEYRIGTGSNSSVKYRNEWVQIHSKYFYPDHIDVQGMAIEPIVLPHKTLYGATIEPQEEVTAALNKEGKYGEVLARKHILYTYPKGARNTLRLGDKRYLYFYFKVEPISFVGQLRNGIVAPYDTLLGKLSLDGEYTQEVFLQSFKGRLAGKTIVAVIFLLILTAIYTALIFVLVSNMQHIKLHILYGALGTLLTGFGAYWQWFTAFTRDYAIEYMYNTSTGDLLFSLIFIVLFGSLGIFIALGLMHKNGVVLDENGMLFKVS